MVDAYFCCMNSKNALQNYWITEKDHLHTWDFYHFRAPLREAYPFAPEPKYLQATSTIDKILK